MSKCRNSNFVKKDNSEDLNFHDLKGKSVEEIIDAIDTVLEEAPFSTDFEASDDPDNYKDSINSLIDTIIEKLEHNLNRISRNYIRKYLKNKLLPREYTKVEENIMAVIPEANIVSEDDRRSMDLEKALDKIYGYNVAINTFRLAKFNSEMKIKTIIDVENRKIIDSPKNLNLGIISYQEEQFRILKDFLIKLGFDESLMPNSLYTSSYQVDPLYNGMLLMMYNYILNEKNKGTFDSELERLWINTILGKNDILLHDAVNAYVNLTYFNKVLKECFGDYISNNYKLKSPIKESYNDGLYEVLYKYTFKRGNENTTKNWGVEEHDSTKEMSKFQKILIESIPVYNFKMSEISGDISSDLEYGRLDSVKFLSAFCKLFDIADSLTEEAAFKEAINTFDKDTEEKIQIIFNRLFEDPEQILLKKLKLDMNNINYLYSVYRTVFKGRNSWKSIEDEYIKDNGYTSRYSLVKTLLGVINSNISMNYVQTVYNSEESQYITSIKSKYYSNSTIFDIVTNTNDEIIERSDKKELLSKYKLFRSGNDNSDYTITLNNFGNPLIFNIITTNKSGILDKKFNSNDLIINKIDELAKVDLSNKSQRDKLLIKSNLTDDEKALMTVLDFIDNMLGTNFSKDSDGLLELYLLLEKDKNNLKELFASAARALVVTDIYNLFNENNEYAITNLLQFLQDKDVYSKKILSLNEFDKKQYFIKRFDGYQLTTLRANQKWISDLALIRAIMSGNTSKSVISNLSYDKIPNYSPTYLGARIKRQLLKSRENRGPTSNLLFVNNPNAIDVLCVNADVMSDNYLKKMVKNMSEREIIYDSIVNKFITPLLNDKCIYTQPTTYSDKTKFILYKVALNSLKVGSLSLYDSMFSDNFDEIIEDLIINTIGKSYKGIYNQIIEDYKQIFPLFVSNGELNLSLVLNWLKTHNEENIVTEAKKANVTVYKDVHYRKGKNLSINELLYEYANNLYNPKNLHDRLESEKFDFINDLLSRRLKFKLSFNNSNELDSSGNQMTRFLITLLGANGAKEWVQDDRMTLAKVVNKKTGAVRNIVSGKIELQANEMFVINPVLNVFFMLDNLVGNNLRFSLTGSEINHTIKWLPKLDFNLTTQLKELIKLYNPNYDGGKVTFYDLDLAIKNFNGTDKTLKKIIKELIDIYNTNIHKVENAGQNAQFKRNVIIPGTIRPYLSGTLEGIGYKMKVAVINDVKADVFNFNGNSDQVKSHDGSAFINPFSSILENKSLQDCEVGTIKKPIQHWYDDRYMSATLLKYAVDTITNRWMLQAEGNDPRNNHNGITLRNVFKKMTNNRWHNGSWKYGEINLIDGCDFKNISRIDFVTDILEKKNLYYRDGVNHKLICDFGIENGVYYTIESNVDSIGELSEPITKKKVYHYFTDDDSQHMPSDILLEDTTGLHTIDSLFELHTALGGIYSESIDDEGRLQYSEASNYAVVQFINHVATLKPDADPNNLSQDSYYLPLKEAMIDVIANDTAIKNGAGNINQTSAFYNDEELTYIELETDNYGIQMDADHTADEAQMTEFSLVISSLDAQGYLHDYVSQIYTTLGELALKLCKIELDAVNEFRKTGDKSKLYDVIGRTIINHLGKLKNRAGLTNAIINNISKEFNLNSNHSRDIFKIPFSDPNIYSTILSTFVSIINNKAIKRKYPGLGTVMVPSYDISMIYDLDGKNYQYEDLIKLAINAGFTSNIKDLSMKNRDIVQLFLQSKLNELPIYTNLEIFKPTDRVRISYNQVFNTDILDSKLVEWEIVDKPLGNKALNIYIKGQRDLGYFLLVKDNEDDFYSVYFYTGDADTQEMYGSTPEQRNILYQLLFNAIPDGAKVSTYGNISEGGLYALNKLMANTTIIEQRTDNVFNREETVPIFLKSGNYRESISKVLEISLDSIEDYYLFKDDIISFLNNKGIINPTNITYLNNITVPRNLAPARIFWEYDDETGHHYMNIFDHWRIKGLFAELNRISKLDDKKERKRLEKEARDKYDVQLAFLELNKGEYHTISGNVIEVKNLSNIPAELIMSNIYKSKFEIDNGDTLADIIDSGKNYFLKVSEPITSDNYDIVYTNKNNENIYIDFKDFSKVNKDSNRIPWENIVKRDFEYPENYEGEKTIINEVYAVDDNNVELFKIGREILRNDVEYKDGVYISKSTLKVLPNQLKYIRYGEDKVLEYVEFISKNEVREEGETYTLYTINKNNIRRVFVKPEYNEDLLIRRTNEGEVITITRDQKFNEEIDNFIGRLLSKIYHSGNFNGIQLNLNIRRNSAFILKRALYTLESQLLYDNDLSTYVHGLATLLTNSMKKDPIDNRYEINNRAKNRLLNEYTLKLVKKQYSSFKKSLYFTASRIPAQTLQSFMQMKCVGFTGTPNNQCFVSHWQTW